MINIKVRVVDRPWGKEERNRGLGDIVILYFLAWVVITQIFIQMIILLIVNICATHVCICYNLQFKIFKL